MELLVVIVVIGILAAITIVSYSGISAKATVATLKSDLDNAKRQLSLYYVDHSAYPDSMVSNCPSPVDAKYCIKSSGTNTFTYSPASATPQAYSLTARTGSTVYNITNDSGPVAIPVVTIGAQTWMQYNLNVGTMVTGVTNQADNSIVEKYCYNDTLSNCTTYGGLYQWNEAMQYVVTAGAYGICPASFHIPTDTEYKTLETQLGMTQVQADLLNAWRGTDQGTQLKSGGLSGLNLLLAGYHYPDGLSYVLGSFGYIWSSSEYSVGSNSAWLRHLASGGTTVYRYSDVKGSGFSVRCVGN